MSGGKDEKEKKGSTAGGAAGKGRAAAAKKSVEAEPEVLQPLHGPAGRVVTTRPRPLPEADLEMDEVLRLVHGALDEKKAENIVMLDLSGVVDYLDYIVIASGQTDIHNRALVDSVQEMLGRYAIIADGVSGYRSGGWIVLDYGVLAVHVFTPAMRDFYRLDELWEAGEPVDMPSG